MKRNKLNQNFILAERKRDIVRVALYCLAFALIALLLMHLSNTKDFQTGRTLFAVSIALFVLTVALALYAPFHIVNKEKRLKQFIETFSFSTENITRAATFAYPDPMVVVTAKGVIKWYNPSFAELCGSEALFGVAIQDVLPAVRVSKFIESKNERQEISYNGRDFILTGTLSSSVNKENTDDMVGLSFADVSEIARLNRKIDEKRCVVCTAVIDNYDEVFKETPTANHGALMGDIENCVGLWVEKGDGFCRRYERDRFIIIFEAAKFEILKEEKFAILDEVKEINRQNKLPVTLSIGVGATDDDITENEKFSALALDMALGRGGDQAVMKTNEKYLFFGAKSFGVEKTTKVKARIVADSLSGLIDASSNVIIMGHKNADFDSFGSAVGLFRAVLDRGKTAYIAMDKTHNNVGEILPDLLLQYEYGSGVLPYDRLAHLADKNTLLIIVDTHRPSMVEYPELLTKTENVVLIDHHRRSEEFIDKTVLTYHEPYASSTCEMVAEILQYIGDNQGLSVQEAEALYCGIYMDTKGFTFKTGARTFEAAAYLRKMGADPVGVHKLFRNDLDMYIQKSRIISGAKVYRGNVAIAVCDEALKNLQLVVAQAADELLNINGVEASFVLAPVSNRVIISGRSLGAINVQVILEKLGGGGHITIAGAQLENCSLNIAELRLNNAIDEVLLG